MSMCVGSPRPTLQPAGGQLIYGEILSRRQFVRQLQIEMRRSDRSNSSLSLVLFRVDPDQGADGAELEILMDLLCRTKRETDVIGHLGDGLIGLMLTDTDKSGIAGFTSKVADRAAGLSYSTSSGTYPDQLFDSLTSNAEGLSDTFPYFVGLEAGQGSFRLGLKRCIDVVGATALLVVASPAMLIAAIAVKMSSPGPVIYAQTRLGRKAVPFTFYKFRSMTAGADDTVHREYVARLIEGRHAEVNQGDEQNPIYKLRGDARITRVGAFIRRTSIDELPQLFNVLKGDLSLVGPRPPLVYEAELYESWHLRRVLECRPGITGLWQVQGRNRVSFDEMVRLDLRYIRNSSLWLDLKILLKTVLIVFRSKGDG